MKKIILTVILLSTFAGNCFALDKFSKEYLQQRKHIAVMNPLAESIVEKTIKSALKKETGADFKVKFSGYTLASMKKGIFKSLELTGKDIVVENIEIPYVHVKTLSDYNYIDYTQDPIVFKSDMKLEYDLLLSDKSMNAALKHSNYKAVLDNINKLAYPMFEVKGVSTKIKDNQLYILTEYNFPIAPAARNRIFTASADFKVKEGKIKATNVKLDSGYGKISLTKVANMLNLLNPLEFTMELLDSKKCDANVENVNIVDNKVKVDGKIFVKGD